MLHWSRTEWSDEGLWEWGGWISDLLSRKDILRRRRGHVPEGWEELIMRRVGGNNDKMQRHWACGLVKNQEATSVVQESTELSGRRWGRQWPSFAVSRPACAWPYQPWQVLREALKCSKIETGWMSVWVNEWLKLLHLQKQEFLKWKESDLAVRCLFSLNKYHILVISSPSFGLWGWHVWLTLKLPPR